VRFDFPGGWNGDPVNKFTPKGRTSKENEAWKWIQTLNKARTSMPALGVGKTMQYSGINGIYVFFRYTDNQKAMVVLSQNDAAQEIVMSRFAEITTGYSKLRNVMTGEITPLGNSLRVAAKGSYVFELMK
jgi:hypothetical protein